MSKIVYKKMNPEYKKLWIDTLRSGTVDQVHGQLAVVDYKYKRGVGFCCLGVLGAIYNAKECPTINLWNSLPTPTIYCEYGNLPEVIIEKAGLGLEEQDVCANLNDCGYNFIGIANWIEKNL